MKLPDNQQDRDMLARELLVRFQTSPNHPLQSVEQGLPEVLSDGGIRYCADLETRLLVAERWSAWRGLPGVCRSCFRPRAKHASARISWKSATECSAQLPGRVWIRVCEPLQGTGARYTSVLPQRMLISGKLGAALARGFVLPHIRRSTSLSLRGRPPPACRIPRHRHSG